MKSWFAAVWFITNQKNGVSALGIQRLLGLGSYQTAWSLMHKLRYAMVDPERDKLSGIVEVDETLIGGVIPKSSIKNQQGKRKAIVLVAVELLSPSGFGRIRLRQVESATKEHIHQFIQDVIEPGSTICSDGSQAYKQIDKKGYKHNRMVHLGSSVPAHETMAGVHRVSSLCKRWLLGTYQGSGTDVAIESADITLMRSSLHGISDVIGISSATMKNIKQNLWGAFLYNSLGIPVAAGLLFPFTGWLLSPIIAGAAMSLSSVTVVTNANRLRLYAPSQPKSNQ